MAYNISCTRGCDAIAYYSSLYTKYNVRNVGDDQHNTAQYIASGSVAVSQYRFRPTGVYNYFVTKTSGADVVDYKAGVVKGYEVDGFVSDSAPEHWASFTASGDGKYKLLWTRGNNSTQVGVEVYEGCEDGIPEGRLNGFKITGYTQTFGPRTFKVGENVYVMTKMPDRNWKGIRFVLPSGTLGRQVAISMTWNKQGQRQMMIICHRSLRLPAH